MAQGRPRRAHRPPPGDLLRGAGRYWRRLAAERLWSWDIAHEAVSLALGAIEKDYVRHTIVPVALIEGRTLGPAPAASRR